MAGFGNRNGGDDDGFSPEHLARLGARVVQALGSRLLTLIVLGLLLITAWASYYQIEPEEVGLITRFGAYRSTSQPGPHFKLPLAEQVFRVPVKRQLKEEFGFRTQRAAIRSDALELRQPLIHRSLAGLDALAQQFHAPPRLVIVEEALCERRRGRRNQGGGETDALQSTAHQYSPL